MNTSDSGATTMSAMNGTVGWLYGRAARIALATAVAVFLGACGNLTAGGVGEASVTMSGDAPDEGESPQMAIVSGPSSSSHDDDQPEGEVEADLTVFLVAADGEVVPITDGEVQVRVDLEGVEEPLIGSQLVGATTYTHLRIVFTEIEVEVDQGLVIGDIVVTGPIDIEFDGSLTVDRAIDVEVADGERVDLLVDLNAERWLLAVDPVALTVDAQIFANLVTVRRR